MSEFYSEQISKEVESITENIRLIREVQKNRLNESLLMLSQGWNGEAFDKLIKKSQIIYENLNELTSRLEETVDQLIDNSAR